LGCKNKHLERAEHHVAVSLKESKDAMCTKHPDKRVEFCCVDPCHELIYSTCGLLEHATHKFSSLPEAAERERGELERVAEESTEAISGSLAATKKALEDCVAYIAGLHESVKAEGEKLVRLMEQRMAEAHAAIDAKMSPELHRLRKAVDAAGGVWARVRSHAAVTHRLRDPEKCSHAEVFRLSPVSE
jgi:hypothetical protein